MVYMWKHHSSARQCCETNLTADDAPGDAGQRVALSLAAQVHHPVGRLLQLHLLLPSNDLGTTWTQVQHL